MPLIRAPIGKNSAAAAEGGESLVVSMLFSQEVNHKLMTFHAKLQDLNEQMRRIEDSGVTAGSEPFIRFLIDCSSLVRHRLPSVALEALDVAAEYQAGCIPVEQIIETVVRCWRELDDKYKGKDVDVPAVAAIRAVIFLLDSLRNPNEKDIFDRLQYFLDFVNLVEPHLQEEALLLDKHFPDSVSGPLIN